MHLIYKQNYNKDNQEEIDDIFIEYFVPIVDYLDHPALIEEWKQIIDAADHENNLNQDVKIPSGNKQIDLNEKT